jgi:hypothetical protein
VPRRQHECVFETVREVGAFIKKRCRECKRVKYFLKVDDEDGS